MLYMMIYMQYACFGTNRPNKHIYIVRQNHRHYSSVNTHAVIRKFEEHPDLAKNHLHFNVSNQQDFIYTQQTLNKRCARLQKKTYHSKCGYQTHIYQYVIELILQHGCQVFIHITRAYLMNTEKKFYLQ